MSERSNETQIGLESMSEHELLLLMDLAMETLEGLDQLGVETKAQLEALMADIERRIADGA